jgi:hypothetical protein
VQRVVDRGRVDAKPRGGVAVDHHVDLRAGAILVRRNIDNSWRGPQFVFQCQRRSTQHIDVLGDDRVLVLRAALSSATAQVLRREQRGLHALHLFEWSAQPGDHRL